MQNWLNNLIKNPRTYFVISFIFLLSLGVFTLFYFKKTASTTKDQKTPDVTLPTIINGELVLPNNQTKNDDSNLNKIASNGQLAITSANLVAIFDQSNKLTGIRIVGETTNIGDKYVSSVSPVVRFFDNAGELVSQKIAHLTSTFDFHDLAPKDKTLYDVTVDSPPTSDRVEVFFNTISSSDSAIFEPLKIASRSLETKTTTTGASESAQTVEYYVATGKVVNPFNTNVSDIVVYAWTKNSEGKVFGIGQADYKNDLIAPGQAVDFSIMVLPLQNGQKMSSYEISAWGKEYKLNF